MAGINLGTQGSRRETNRELALVPFIDFLLCLVAFLLVTAVWTRAARLPADTTVPGSATCATCAAPAKRLHVAVEEARFVLSWRDGSTLIARSEVPRKAVRSAGGDVSYPDLARALRSEWQANGVHRAPSDAASDTAVLHAPNGLAYAELVGVMDSIREVRRAPDATSLGSGEPAFVVSLAVD
jgi:biopolymer transport protein ExbD